MTDINFPMKGRKGMVDWARNSEDKVVIPKGLFVSQSAGTWPNRPRRVALFAQRFHLRSPRVHAQYRNPQRSVCKKSHVHPPGMLPKCFVLCHPPCGQRQVYEYLLGVFEQDPCSCQPLLQFVLTWRFLHAFKPSPFTVVLYITQRCQTIWLIVVISLSLNKSKSTKPLRPMRNPWPL